MRINFVVLEINVFLRISRPKDDFSGAPNVACDNALSNEVHNIDNSSLRDRRSNFFPQEAFDSLVKIYQRARSRGFSSEATDRCTCFSDFRVIKSNRGSAKEKGFNLHSQGFYPAFTSVGNNINFGLTANRWAFNNYFASTFDVKTNSNTKHRSIHKEGKWGCQIFSKIFCGNESTVVERSKELTLFSNWSSHRPQTSARWQELHVPNTIIHFLCRVLCFPSVPTQAIMFNMLLLHIESSFDYSLNGFPPLFVFTISF